MIIKLKSFQGKDLAVNFNNVNKFYMEEITNFDENDEQYCEAATYVCFNNGEKIYVKESVNKIISLLEACK